MPGRHRQLKETMININTHSSIKICEDGPVAYFDPWKIIGAPHDADVICVTHDHFDHYSVDDIKKISKNETVLIAPEGYKERIGKELANERMQLVFLNAGDEREFNGIKIEAVPSYNVGKDFHPKFAGNLGYVATFSETRYYVAGDTDDNEDVRNVKCDIALVPIGGKYTMTAEEAAGLINAIRPRIAIPTHYGDIIGDKKDAATFRAAVSDDIEVIEVL